MCNMVLPAASIACNQILPQNNYLNAADDLDIGIFASDDAEENIGANTTT